MTLSQMFSETFWPFMVYNDSKVDFRTLDLRQAATDGRSRTGAILNAVDPDLSVVRAAGKKIIQYHGWADAVISNTVLHLAGDDAQFEAMMRESWRVLKPGGLFFCRLASTIGIEHQVRHLSGRRYLLPDGSERFLVDESLLMSLTRELGASLLDPLKTTVVQNQRSMTTWILRKNG